MHILIVNDTSTSVNQGCQVTMHMFNRCIAATFPGAQVKQIPLTTTNYRYKEPPSPSVKSSSNVVASLKQVIRKVVRPSVPPVPVEYFLPSSRMTFEAALGTILTTRFPLMVELREKVEWADIVIINGEGSILEDQPNARFIFMVCELSAHFRKPCHLINFTAHLTRPEAIALAKRAFGKCASVTVREPLSYYLVKPFFPRVKLFPDIVAGLDVELANLPVKDGSYVMIGGGSATLRMENKPSAMETLKRSISSVVQELIAQGVKVKLIGWYRDEWLQDIQQDDALFEMTDFVHYYITCKAAAVNLTGRHHGCVMSFAAGCPFITTTANCFKNYGDRLLYTSPSEVLEMENFDSIKASGAIMNALDQAEVLQRQIAERKKQIEPFIFGAFKNINSSCPDLVDAGIVPETPSPYDLKYKQNMTP